MGKKRRTKSGQAPFSSESDTSSANSSSCCKQSHKCRVAKSTGLENETAFPNNDSSLPFGTRSQEVATNAGSIDTGSLGFPTEACEGEVEDAGFVKEEIDYKFSDFIIWDAQHEMPLFPSDGKISPSFKFNSATRFDKENVSGEIYDTERLSPSSATEASRSASGDFGAVSPRGSSVEVIILLILPCYFTQLSWQCGHILINSTSVIERLVHPKRPCCLKVAPNLGRIQCPYYLPPFIFPAD